MLSMVCFAETMVLQYYKRSQIERNWHDPNDWDVQNPLDHSDLLIQVDFTSFLVSGASLLGHEVAERATKLRERNLSRLKG